MFPLERIGRQIAALFPGTEAIYSSTVPVRDEFAGAVVWDGYVEVFTLKGHATATRCYAWEEPARKPGDKKVYAYLELPPIGSAADAVRTSMEERRSLK